jgi:hypothetical protein
VREEGLGELKKFIHLVGSRTSDLPACSVVPEPLCYCVPLQFPLLNAILPTHLGAFIPEWLQSEGVGFCTGKYLLRDSFTFIYAYSYTSILCSEKVH